MNEIRSLQIRVIDSLEAFHALAPAWHELIERSETSSLFLTWEWLYHWTAQYLGRHRLWILLMIDDRGRLRGIAPLHIRQVHHHPWSACREIAFLGSDGVGSMYLDVIAEHPDRASVLACFYDYLFVQAAGQWDLAVLEHLPADSATIDLLRSRLEDAGKVVDVLNPIGCPILTLPTSIDAHRQAMRSSLRRTLQRKQRRLERHGIVTYGRAAHEKDREQAWCTFMTLHQQRWATRSRHGGAFRDGRFRRFHEDITRLFHALGRLDISFLQLNGRAVAGIYGFRYQRTYYYYLPGLDAERLADESPGMLLLSDRIEQAIEEGCDRFDLLQGRAGYKTTWTQRSTRCLSMRFYNRTWRAAARQLAEGVTHSAKILLR